MTDMAESAGVKKAAPYDGSDLLYGILSVLFGFLFLKGITSGGAENLGFGMTLLTVLYVISVFIYRGLSREDTSGRRVSWGETILFAAMILLLGGTYAFTTGVGMKATSLVLEVVLILYWIFVLFGNRKENRLDGAAFADSLTAFLIMPFGSFISLFGALFRKRGRRNAGTMGSVLLGLAIAIIPTTVVFLLLSGDLLFKNVTKFLNEFLREYFIIDLVTFIASVPVSMYLFALLYSNRKGRYADVITPEDRRKVSEAVRIVNPVIACSAAAPVIVLYLVYLGLHVGHYFSAFRQYLPAEYTAAEYARSGFFELCVVAVINLVFIGAGALFVRRNEDGKTPLSWALCASLLSLLTIGLVASAISKMALYIGIYGMTYLRVSTTWFMLFVGVVFIFIIIRQFAERFNVIGFTVVTGILMFLLFSYSSPDAWIAEYNVDAWRSGKLDTIDVKALDKLSDGVTPYLIDLAQDSDEKVSAEASAALSRRLAEEEKSLLTGNVGYFYAESKLKAYAAKVAGTEKDIRDVRFIVRNDSEEAIRSFSVLYVSYDKGVLSSVACEKADGSPYENGESVYISFPASEILENEDYHFELEVYTMDGRSYSTGWIYLDELRYSLMNYSVIGDSEVGFSLIVD